MSKLNIQAGDRVCFNAAVVKRCGHSQQVASFTGNVVAVIYHGKLCEVQDGATVRTIPTANLAKLVRGVGVLDATY